MSPHRPEIRREFLRRTTGDWRDLADQVGMGGHEYAGVIDADGPRRVWDWLDARDRLTDLPDALRAIGRDDMADLFPPAGEDDIADLSPPAAQEDVAGPVPPVGRPAPPPGSLGIRGSRGRPQWCCSASSPRRVPDLEGPICRKPPAESVGAGDRAGRCQSTRR